MPSDWQDDEGLPEKRPDDHDRDRGPSRSQVVGRRAVAVGSLVVVLIAVIIVITSAGGGDGGDDAARLAAKRSAVARQKKAAAAKAAEAAESAKVDNATPAADWKPYAGPVPILEYHDLGGPPEGSLEPEIYVGRTDFAKQMDWLEERGYEAVTLEQVEEAWFEGATLPAQPIVLSFEDGYRPQFTYALPTLREHGWAGVLDLLAEGSELYESNVEEMIAAGWELAAQATSETALTELGSAELQEEVAGSREILEGEFDAPVKNFSYPDGEFDETVVEAAEAAGYVGATTETAGLAEKAAPFELARLEVLRESHLAGLAEALRGAAEPGA